jgi:hypothetical protein
MKSAATRSHDPEPTLVAEALEAHALTVYDPNVWAIAQRQSIE